MHEDESRVDHVRSSGSPEKEVSPWVIPGVPSIISGEVLERVREGGSISLDTFLSGPVASMREAYRASTPPSVVLRSAEELLGSEVILERKEPGSIEYARLLHLVAEMHIASGLTAGRSVNLVQLAMEEIRQIRLPSQAVSKLFADCALLEAVGRKAVGRLDVAMSRLLDVVESFEDDFADPLARIPLVRQYAMFVHTDKLYEEIAREAPRYARASPLEYYRTVKRIFEYFINTGRAVEAEAMLPEFRRAFGAIARVTTPISHISFQKNIGHLCLALGKAGEARNVFSRSYQFATLLGLQGQARQLASLFQEVGQGNRGAKLVPLRTEE